MGLLSEEFKEAYKDGAGQTTENIRYCLKKFFEENNLPLWEKADEIITYAGEVDDDYLNQ